ncbi:hypothetical protein H0E87_020231, partial [Populus deltoides]
HHGKIIFTLSSTPFHHFSFPSPQLLPTPFSSTQAAAPLSQVFPSVSPSLQPPPPHTAKLTITAQTTRLLLQKQRPADPLPSVSSFSAVVAPPRQEDRLPPTELVTAASSRLPPQRWRFLPTRQTQQPLLLNQLPDRERPAIPVLSFISPQFGLHRSQPSSQPSFLPLARSPSLPAT